MENPKALKLFKPLLDAIATIFGDQSAEESDTAQEAITAEMSAAMMKDMPLRAATNFSGGAVTYDQINAILEQVNKA